MRVIHRQAVLNHPERLDRVESHRLRIQAELQEAIEEERKVIEAARAALKIKSPPLQFKTNEPKVPPGPRRNRQQWTNECLVNQIDRINAMWRNLGWSM